MTWIVERKQRVKTRGLQRQKKEKQDFYQNVKCVAVKNYIN